MRYVRGLGQLPPLLRAGIRQFGIHKGDQGFHGGPGKIFMYQDRTTLRIAQNHLEESLMHEAVHASLDATYRDDPAWRAAQDSDGRFVTAYAAAHPEGEDLAESLLFAYGLLRHPGRIPPVDSDAIGEGGAAFFCRSTGYDSVQALRDALEQAYEDSAARIDAALAERDAA